MTVVDPPRFAPPARFGNGAEWLRALGGVPPERIVFDPWPGTATEADLLRYLEHEKRLCELIDGTLVEKPVGILEAAIALNLGIELGYFVRRNNLGAVTGPDSTLRMSSGRVRLPDLCFFARDRLPNGLLPSDPVPSLAPDLAVEVLSEGNTADEIGQKLREYFQSGTRMTWVIHPRTHRVAVYHGPGEPTRWIDDAGVLDGEQVVPGFVMPVHDLFRNVPPAT